MLNMDVTPKISIAIITYNRARELKIALINIIREIRSLPDGLIEIVISDNASDDDTEQVVNAFGNRHIKYHRNEVNVGGAENVLLACARSKGEFVLFHADDDLLCENAIEVLLDMIVKHPEVGVISSSLIAFNEDEPDKPLRQLRFPSHCPILYLKKENGEALGSLFLRACNFSGLVIKRDLLDFQGARAGVESMYPQIYLVGAACKKADAIYLSEPLMKLRLERKRRWNYTTDYMSGAMFSILNSLIKDEDWGGKVRKQIIRKRILAAYGPLLTARDDSWKAFGETANGFFKVAEYRKSRLFWCMVAGIGLLGSKGIRAVRRIWNGPKGADVIS